MLILLDIDGVMIPAASWKAPELLNDDFPNFSSKAVSSLNKILAKTNASILITSSHKSRFTNEAWKKIFARRGIKAKVSKLDVAPTSVSRKDEIVGWFQSYPTHNFVIIDDDKSLNDLPAKLKDRLVLTSPLIGLTEELADKAIGALNQTAVLPS